MVCIAESTRSGRCRICGRWTHEIHNESVTGGRARDWVSSEELDFVLDFRLEGNPFHCTYQLLWKEILGLKFLNTKLK
jgi:hypothetical protein